MYCRKCGCELADDARFCRKCGAAVTGNQQEPSAPAPTPAEAAPVKAAAPTEAAAPPKAAAPVKTPVPTRPSGPAAKAAPAQKRASTEKADKIDFPLIAAVAVFLLLQMAIVLKVVSNADRPAAVSAQPVQGGEDTANAAQSYFSKELRVGGKVEFGRYEQDGNTEDGAEPIVWDVVASFEDGYLLVSRYILDALPWDDGSGAGGVLELKTDITYEQCSMRRWIQDNFVPQAFTEEELAMIVPVSVTKDDVLARKGNQYAKDYAFILRDDEVEDFWGDAAPDRANASLACAPTEYATWGNLAVNSKGNARHSYNDNFATASWALRRRYTDPKSKEAKIVTVDPSGRFSNSVVSETLGFRPAIYIIPG